MRPSLRKTAALLGGLAVVAAAVLGQRRGAEGDDSVWPRSRATVRAPEFPGDLEWLNTDQPLSLEALTGKVVLLDFWTYCCINCMHILPELERLEDRWPDELVVIGVHSAKFTGEGLTDNIRAAILRYGIRHPVVNDVDFRVWRQYGVRAWPTLVLIDPRGRIVAQQPGEATFEQLDPAVAAVVAEAARDGSLDRRPLERRLERDRVPRAVLSYPGKVVADELSGQLLIADSSHHRYLIATFDGEVTAVIGSGEPGFADGDYASARFRRPQGAAFYGGKWYLADTENHALRVADPTSRTVTTLVGDGRKPRALNRPGRGQGVRLHSPWDVLAIGERLFVANAGSHQIWIVDPATGDAAPYAGSAVEDLIDGRAYRAGQFDDVAALAQPSGLTTDGRRLYFADSETSSVRAVDLGPDPRVVTLIGEGLFEFGDIDGTRPTARLQHPLGVAWHDGALYVADTYNNRIKRLDLATGGISAFAGTGAEGDADGPVERATFDEPGGLSYAAGKLYVADTNNHAIRVVDLAERVVTTLALRGLETARPPMPEPEAVALPAVRLRPGDGRLRLEIALPAGLKLNPDAPLAVRVTSDPPGVVALADGPRARLAAGVPPFELPLRAQPGSAAVTIAVDLYYCSAAGGGACYFDSARFQVPVTVAADGDSTLIVRHELPPRR